MEMLEIDPSSNLVHYTVEMLGKWEMPVGSCVEHMKR